MDKDPRAGSTRVLAIVERNIMENLQKQKNYGMELLRILAAVLVLQLHILGQGAIYPNTGASIVTAKYAVNYAVSWSLETAAYGAVDLFALISGFVGLYSGFKVKRWMRLWALCVFWGVTMFLLFDHGVAVVQAFDDLLLNMGLDVGPTVERLVATGMDYHDVIFTVGSKQFWYFNMYTLLFILLPVLNAGLQKLDKKQMAVLSFMLFFAASVHKTVFNRDLFVLGGGYSTIWLVILYIVGATAKKYYDDGFRPNKWLCVLGYLVCTGVSVGFKFWFEWLFSKNPDVAQLKNYSGVLISYTGPFIVIGSVLLLFAFMQLTVKSKVGRKITLTFSGASFGIYIIQVTTPVWDHFMKLRFYRYAYLPTGEMLLSFYATLALLYLLFAAMEILRIYLFKYSRFERLIDFCGDGITRLVQRLFAWRDRKEQAAVPQPEAPEPPTE